jgi:hypothetical protein
MKKLIGYRYFCQFTYDEIEAGHAYMMDELLFANVSQEIYNLFFKAWNDFKAGKFSYDGATFVRERSKSVFEVAAFIHDWRNAMGYVSYAVDREMLDIMITLNYELTLIKWRWLYTRFTFLNIARHKLLCTYVGSKPTDLYKLIFKKTN